MIRRNAMILCVTTACACSGDGSFLGWRVSGEHTQGTAKVGGDVVSTVDGVAITVGDVQALVDASGMAPRDALSRLQSEALLIGEAKRRGYQKNPSVERTAREALVQALLEKDVEAERATDDEIARAYEAQHERFHPPERRGGTHFLARLGKNATLEQEARARALAEEAINALRGVTEPAPVFQELALRSTPGQPVKVERLPEVPKNGTFVKPFEDALFSVPSPGVVPEPVRTEYGWHAIYVRTILPKQDLGLEEVRATLRAELDTAKRKQRLDALSSELRRDVRVDVRASDDAKLGELEL